MLPILLNQDTVRVGLAGAGPGFTRRAALLAEAGIAPIPVIASDVLPRLDILFVAGLERDAAAELARQARAVGILINVEDVPELCDFHVPAIVRRGDLVLTASTGGRAPGLARRLREWLEGRFGPEWSEHLADIGSARAGWRDNGLPPDEVSRRTGDLLTRKGWLQ